jgi:hypothetical protein
LPFAGGGRVRLPGNLCRSGSFQQPIRAMIRRAAAGLGRGLSTPPAQRPLRRRPPTWLCDHRWGAIPPQRSILFLLGRGFLLYRSVRRNFVAIEKRPRSLRLSPLYYRRKELARRHFRSGRARHPLGSKCFLLDLPLVTLTSRSRGIRGASWHDISRTSRRSASARCNRKNCTAPWSTRLCSQNGRKEPNGRLY